MCGRFALSKSDRIDWAQFGVKRGPMLPPHWNLGPGRAIAAGRDAGEGPEVAMLRWGLIPFWASDPTIGNRLANARAESAAEKPAFRAAFRARRCLIPADGFYEWQVVSGQSKKQPWFVQRADGGVFALAGLWERWEPKAGAARPDGDTVVECVDGADSLANAGDHPAVGVRVVAGGGHIAGRRPRAARGLGSREMAGASRRAARERCGQRRRGLRGAAG
jgi:putative SOS response-associated peptidase YedK